MEYLYERVAYLRGLCEGLGIAEETKEGRVLGEIVEILGEFADAIVELSDKQDELEEYTESIDEDLSDLEDDFYEEDEDEDEDEDDDEMGYVEVTCPHCGEEIEIDEDLLYDEESDIICPCCDQVVINACDDEDFEDFEEEVEEEVEEEEK